MTVAAIPENVRSFLSATTHEVGMEKDYARKLLVDKQLTYEHLHLIQSAINHGYCVVGKTPNHLDFLFFDEKGKAWITVIKWAKSGTELWFCTLFYTNDKKYYVAKFRRQRLLREHSGLD